MEEKKILKLEYDDTFEVVATGWRVAIDLRKNKLYLYNAV